jgi:hypothetical protein
MKVVMYNKKKLKWKQINNLNVWSIYLDKQ